MSKSLGNYIGIEEDAREMFAKTMRVPDGLILKYFELATDILPEELDSIREELADGCNPRDVKLKLAREITELYWGKEGAEKGEEFFRTAFMNRENPCIRRLRGKRRGAASADCPGRDEKGRCNGKNTGGGNPERNSAANRKTALCQDRNLLNLISSNQNYE